MDVAHKDHLLAAARHALGVAALVLCLLAELLVFVSQRHAALYAAPVCAMLLQCFFNRRGATAGDVGLVDFACLRPPRRLRIPKPGLLEHLRLIGCFDEGSVEFMSRVIEGCGMGDETYFPPSLHYIPPSATHADAIQEAHMLFFPTLDDLFARTGVRPSAVGALVVNCSGFCPAPSLAAIIANRYRMRADVRTFNLSGMGCAAGVVGVDVARGVMRAHASAVRYAVVVSAEIVTVGWYSGRDRRKLLLNCFFRTGCAAELLSSPDAGGGSVGTAVPAKYRLVTLARTNRTADDRSYMSAVREEDDEGVARRRGAGPPPRPPPRARPRHPAMAREAALRRGPAAVLTAAEAVQETPRRRRRRRRSEAELFDCGGALLPAVIGEASIAAADEGPWADCIHRFPVREP